MRSPRERRSIWRVGPESTWTTTIPVAFVILSLISLVILPLVVANHTAQMRGEITRLAEPARRTANEVQMDLASELDKVIAYQVTGQQQYRNEYVRLIREQVADYESLRELGPQLNVQVGVDLADLMAQTNRWHSSVQSGEFLSRQLPPEVFQTRLFERHPSYEKALFAAGKLELEIQEAIDDRLKSIRDLERWNIGLTIFLTLLALTSALLVAGLGRQMRMLAKEAMQRRRDAERDALSARLARAAAEREERRAAFLASAGQELTTSLELDETIAMLARLFVPNLGEICAVDTPESDGTLRRAVITHRDAAREVALQASSAGRRIEDPPEAIARVMNGREAKIIGAASGLVSYVDPDLSTEQRSMMVVPLVSRGETLGVVTIIAAEGRVFAREDVALAGELARHGSLAIDNARLYLASQQAVRAREEMLAIVSHDLRNPLNAVMLAAALMKTNEKLPAEECEQVDTIEFSAQRMQRLIEDLLDVTRLEGGKQLPIEPAPIDVGGLLREAYDLFKTQAAAGEITFQYHVGDAPRVYADHHRVLQVLSNLIGNSMKFTGAGGLISVSAGRRDSHVLFTVSDTGPGIPRENLKDIFYPYWQAKRTARMGAGLGLPIAKGIVEAHGGQIWAESGQGVGTKFFFTLPIARATVEESASSQTHSAPRKA